MKQIILYIVLIFSVQALSGQSATSTKSQSKKMDKVEMEDMDMKEEEFKAEGAMNLIERAKGLSQTRPAEAVDLLEDYFSNNYRYDTNDPYLDQQAYFILGKIYMDLQRFNSAIDAFQKVNSIGTNADRSKEKGRKTKGRRRESQPVDQMLLAEYLGIAYTKANQTGEANTWLEAYLKIASSRQDKAAQIKAENLLGDLWTAQKDLKKAEIHYQNAIRLSNEANDKRSYVNSLDNLARNYQAQQNTFEARQSYNRKVEVAEELDDDTLIAQAYEQIAETFEKENNLDSALIAENMALEKINSAGDTATEVKKKNKISSLYLRKDEPKEAIDILKESLAIAQKIGEVDAQAKAHELLAQGYEKQGKIDLALFHYKRARVLQDTLAAKKAREFKSILSQSEQIAVKDKKIATLEKEQELQGEKIKSLQERESFQRRIMTLLGLGLLIVSVSAFLVIRSNRARRRSNQLLALKSLRSQMNPHFIFNSLNSINGFIARHDDRTANKYLSDFSKLMRTVLDNSQLDFVSLATELEVLQLYVKLEHFRFGDKFDYELNIDPTLRQEQIEIPPMLVQPYIENAIWHGLRYKPEKGYLKIDIESRGEQLRVKIEDDGIGRKQSTLLKTRNQKSHKSTGLKNTTQRVNIINELYGASLSVEIEDIFPEKEHTGTRVVIQMPMRIKED